MHGAGGKILAVFPRPVVGGEFDLDPTLVQRRGERRGRKQMPAGSARGQKDAARPAHSAATRSRGRSAIGRRRVAASKKPMPRPSAISDEPP